jgi:hypothetical protein
MVRANVIANMGSVFETFNYRPLRSEVVNGWTRAMAALAYPRPDAAREHVHKAVVWHSGWTVVLDPELVMATEEAACTALARKAGAPVFTMLCEGTSGSYAFSLYDPELKRAYFVVDGEVHDDRGVPIPEEKDLRMEALFEDDVLLIMERLGVRYQSLETLDTFTIWTLDESHLAPAPSSEGTPVAKKPWWKPW